MTYFQYTYMHNIQHSTFGVPGHAILLSLPPTLLVWSIVAFTVAILAYIVHDATSGDQWSRIVRVRASLYANHLGGSIHKCAVRLICFTLNLV